MDASTRVELRTGRRRPVLGLGTWKLTRETAATVEGATAASGYRRGDQATEVHRAEIFIVARVEKNEQAYDAVQHDLGEMQLDYADLTLIHRPPPSGAGDALWRELMRARDDGLVRDIGVSDYSAKLVDVPAEATREMPVVNQIEWSPFGFSDALLHHYRERKIVVQAYSPLTRGTRLDDERLAQRRGEIRQDAGADPPSVESPEGHGAAPEGEPSRALRGELRRLRLRSRRGRDGGPRWVNEHYSSLGRLSYV